MKKLLILPLLLLTACSGETEVKIEDVINACVILKFYEDYDKEEYTLITLNTNEILYEYYITNCYYNIDFDNNIYTTDYVSAYNNVGELEIKELEK